MPKAKVRKKRKSFELDSLELCVSILNQILREEGAPRSLIKGHIERLVSRINFLNTPTGGLFSEIERLRLEGNSWELIAQKFNGSGRQELKPPRGSNWTGCNVRMWYTRYLEKHRKDLDKE